MIKSKSYNLLAVDDPLEIAGLTFSSRLLVGSGKYKSLEVMKAAIEASGAEIVTVALRRADLSAKGNSIEDYIDQNQYTYLPNSSGCYTAEEAIRTFNLAREAGGGNLVKLEIIGDKKNLYPDMEETLKATRILAKDDFDLMVYMNDDPVYATKLEDAGAAAVMPLAAPIGSGLGIRNPHNIKMIIEGSGVPVLIDAGIGTASDAAIAMELGCDGVLLNTAIAEAKYPVKMAESMKYAVIAGRLSFLAGRMSKREIANPSSPEGGII